MSDGTQMGLRMEMAFAGGKNGPTSVKEDSREEVQLQ